MLENPGCPYPGQPTFSGTGDIYIEKTYVGGIGQEMKSLLKAEKLAGNGNGLRGQDISWIASGQSFGQFLLLGFSCVHEVGIIPFLAALLERPKALIALRQQGDTAFKFRCVKEAGPVAWPGCCPAKMKCQGRARPRC
jgi:hypothetical protein